MFLSLLILKFPCDAGIASFVFKFVSLNIVHDSSSLFNIDTTYYQLATKKYRGIKPCSVFCVINSLYLHYSHFY